jgi:hypothetical protein
MDMGRVELENYAAAVNNMQKKNICVNLIELCSLEGFHPLPHHDDDDGDKAKQEKLHRILYASSHHSR